MPTLTKQEAAERARVLAVRAYVIELDLSRARASETFGSTTTIRFECREPGTTTFAEVRPRAIQRATLDGEPLDISTLQENRLPLTDLYAGDHELVVTAEMAYSHTGEGLHRSVDPADGEVYLYAMTFLDEAQRIFACFDQPDLKAPVTLAVHAPADWTVIGNEAASPIGNGRWTLAETKPLATYFVTVVAGPYHSVHADHDGLRLGFHCRRSLAEFLDREADELITITRQGLDYYQRAFGVRYPFGQTYDWAFVPQFNAGAMENPGCVTSRDEMLFRGAVTEAERERRATTIVHEMAHMWFGDLVTMKWWDDLWLNESFADFMAYRCAAEATRFTDARAAFAIEEIDAYVADQRPSTHPISAEVADGVQALTNFDRISYDKGCAVLGQLAAFLGDEAFFAGLRAYFQRHAFGNTELRDLLSAWETASGRDLTEWARVWLREANVDTLRPVVELDGDRGEAYGRVVIEQTAPASHPTLRPHRVEVGLYDLPAKDGDGESVVRRASYPVEITGEHTEIPALQGVRAPDLLLVNDQNLTYAKIRLDPVSLDRLPNVLPRLTNPLTRAVLWTALADLVRDAELPARRYVELVGAALPTETNPPLARELLFMARFLTDLFAPPGERDQVVRLLANACRDLTAAEGADDGLRLLATRGVIANALAEDVPGLQAWLDNRGLPAGVTLDVELRWLLLRRLAVLGAVDGERIDAELATDDTTSGRHQAAGCRASLPTPEAKAQAWHDITADESLPNDIVHELVEGFWQPEQVELTQAYVQRYFEEMPAFERERSTWLVAYVTLRGFPLYAVDPDTIARAEALLAREDIGTNLRRSLIDNLDTLRRAYRARTTFGD